MSFIGSIFLLAAVCCGVFIPMIVGHALASHELGKLVYALVFLALAAVFSVLHAKFGDNARTHSGHH